MRRADLEHIIRAAAEVSGDNELVIVGSQAILGQYPDAPHTMLASRDADLYPRNHPDRADVIDGSLGEGSYFDSSFGYYAHAVGPETAKAPVGWEARLIPVRGEGTGGATGWCLEAHDLMLSKCVAGRERDWEFVEDAIKHGLVDPGELRLRAPELPLDGALLTAVTEQLEGAIQRALR